MTVTIYSESPIDDTMYDQVLDILKHSQCPHESLVNSFGDQYYTMVNLGDEICVYFTDLQMPPPYIRVYEM